MKLCARVLAIAAAVVGAVTACGDDPMTPATPDPPVPTTVAISPTSAAFPAIGDSVRLITTVSDQYGQAMTDVAVVWNSSDTSVATVTEGLVTAVGNGNATVTATAGPVTASAEVAVDQLVAELVVSPATHTLVAIGDTVRFVAEARDGNGHEVTSAEFVWSSDDESVVTVNAGGLATAAANGSAQVTATSRSQTTGAEVTVAQKLGAVVVTPSTDTLVALGDTLRLSVEAMDANGHAVSGTVFTWVSGDTLVAVVNGTGLATAVGNGVTTVTAASGGALGGAMVAVIQLAESVIVTPGADSVALGDTLSLSAEAWDANGYSVVGANLSWSSSDESVATVDASGLVHGVTEGTAKISAETGSARGIAQIAVFNPDRAALVALYEATDGPNWLNNENWLTDAPLGDWYGVRMLGDRVGYLDLRRNGLAGPIPAQLGTLSGLRTLRLGDNTLTGPIPAELANTRLRILTLDDNELSGPIPRELGRLARLKWLMLNKNALTGSIPPELGNTSLTALWLSRNKLTGPIPPELGKLVDLESFLVSVNPGLRGEIPPEVLALKMEDHFQSHATGLCVPRTSDFDSYIAREGWIGYACGETEPGFQIELVFHPDVPDQIREAMRSQAEYWMEILRDTEAPDLFGARRYHNHIPDWAPSGPDLIDDIVVTVYLHERTGVRLHGLNDLFRHRLPYQSYVGFRAELALKPRWLGLIARHELGHTLGIGSFWDTRHLVRNRSTEKEGRDTYVVSPLAQEAFDAAGGAGYTGPRVPLHQHGDGGRNSHWRTEVFGSELMSWGWSDHVPTSAVTLQALADLGYEVDLSLADPYALPGTAAAAALGAGELPPLELGWEAPPTIVVCSPQVQLDTELEGLSTRLLLRRSSVCAPRW